MTVIDRQRDAALEKSFANGAQISVSFCEPWANAQAPLKVAKWLLRDDSPLLFRPRLDPHQWRWGLSFLGQCSDAAFERNVAQLVALGSYSHESLKDMVLATGIEYDRLELGILHFFSTQKDFDAGAEAAQVMRHHGVDRRVLSRDEVLKTELSLRSFADKIAGGIFTPSDESGDARVFTQELAKRCSRRGARFLYKHDILGFETTGSLVESVRVRDQFTGRVRHLKADSFVAADGQLHSQRHCCGRWGCISTSTRPRAIRPRSS